MARNDRAVREKVTAPTLGRLGRVFFRIGNTTFGGGSPMIAAVQRDLIERQGWITQDDYGLAYAMARITPGTTVLAFCAAIAARVLGVPAAIVAVLVVTFPSAVLAVLLTQGYETWRTNPTVMAAVAGTVAAVAGMMWASVWLILRPHFGGGWRALRIAIFAGGAFLAAWKFGVTPVPVIGISALIGFFWKERDPA
jgi:chromate transporter